MIPADSKALDCTKLSIDDLDQVEVDDAFVQLAGRVPDRRRLSGLRRLSSICPLSRCANERFNLEV